MFIIIHLFVYFLSIYLQSKCTFSLIIYIYVKGLFYLVYFAYNDETPETIINTPLSFFEEIGLSAHLGQSRSNGLNSLRKKITSIATELSNK